MGNGHSRHRTSEPVEQRTRRACAELVRELGNTDAHIFFVPVLGLDIYSVVEHICSLSGFSHVGAHKEGDALAELVARTELLAYHSREAALQHLYAREQKTFRDLTQCVVSPEHTSPVFVHHQSPVEDRYFAKPLMLYGGLSADEDTLLEATIGNTWSVLSQIAKRACRVWVYLRLSENAWTTWLSQITSGSEQHAYVEFFKANRMRMNDFFARNEFTADNYTLTIDMDDISGTTIDDSACCECLLAIVEFVQKQLSMHKWQPGIGLADMRLHLNTDRRQGRVYYIRSTVTPDKTASDIMAVTGRPDLVQLHDVSLHEALPAAKHQPKTRPSALLRRHSTSVQPTHLPPGSGGPLRSSSSSLSRASGTSSSYSNSSHPPVHRSVASLHDD